MWKINIPPFTRKSLSRLFRVHKTRVDAISLILSEITETRGGGQSYRSILYIVEVEGRNKSGGRKVCPQHQDARDRCPRSYNVK